MYIKFKFYKLELLLYVFFPYICTWKHIFFIFVLESARAMKCWHKVSVGRVIVISFSTQMLDPVGRGVTPFITLHKRTARFHYWSLDPPTPILQCDLNSQSFSIYFPLESNTIDTVRISNIFLQVFQAFMQGREPADISNYPTFWINLTILLLLFF